MTTITIGTRVSFTQRLSYRPYMHTVTGTVVDLHVVHGLPCALVRREDGLLDKWVDVRSLETTTEAKAREESSLAAAHYRELLRVGTPWRDFTRKEVKAQDDVQDYLATCAEPFRIIADDYEFATGEAGNLGGCEL